MNQYTELEIITNLNNLEVIIHQIVDDYPELKLMRTTNGDAPATWEKLLDEDKQLIKERRKEKYG